MQLSVRDVDESTFRKFKAWAAEEDIPVGKALNLAMTLCMQKGRKKAKLTDFKPMSFGKGTEKLSEEIDKVVYG